MAEEEEALATKKASVESELISLKQQFEQERADQEAIIEKARGALAEKENELDHELSKLHQEREALENEVSEKESQIAERYEALNTLEVSLQER